MDDLHSARLERAAHAAGAAGLTGLLVTPGADLRYLTGYAPLPLERLTMLVVSPGRDPLMLVPTLERPAAEAAPAGERIELVSWSDGEDPYQAAGRFLDHQGRYAISDSAWAAHVLGLQRVLGDASFVACGTVLPMLRAVKDEAELELLADAGRGADRSFEAVLGDRFAGRREVDVGAGLAELLRRNGHDTVGFTIVGSGPNGASPHHEMSDRVIEVGDVVVMDFGGTVGGYFSDTTRTVAVGEPSAEVREVHEIVRLAQQAAFEAVRPGVRCEEVDSAARLLIEETGYGDRFIHRTGHGIGLETHEQPYIVQGNATLLEAGMCFSIEPGIYLPGRFGVRIEDIVTVTPEGARRLNDSPRELRIVA